MTSDAVAAGEHRPVSGVHADSPVLDQPLTYYTAPAAERFRRELAALRGDISAGEREILASAASDYLLMALRPKLQRLLLLELHASRMSGDLSAPTPEGRWREFLDMAAGPSFWEKASRTYPALGPRIATVTSNCIAAMVELACRFAADRDKLSDLLPGEGTELTGIQVGVSDRHQGNRSVAVLWLAGGPVVYKPRAAGVDIALAQAIRALLGPESGISQIRVPRVLSRVDYNWTEFAEARFCAHPGEQKRFYQELGRWLAVMTLLGGSDLHMDNILACGPVPVVVDCETLFEFDRFQTPAQFGGAYERASAIIGSTVLRAGILPNRFPWLALRGVDISAAGLLPGEQPEVLTPVIAGAGTDQARLVMEPMQLAARGNHPAAEPRPDLYWEDIVAGFAETAGRIDDLDRGGQLADILEPFRGCRLRAVPRATQTYAELAQMLWHPASLYDEAAAVSRAMEILQRQGATLSGVPLDSEVIAAEVADLLRGDIPVFSRTPECSRVRGPGGMVFGECRDLLAIARTEWRRRDLEADETTIRTSLVGAYLPHAVEPGHSPIKAAAIHGEPFDEQRRRVAARLVRWLCDTAITAEDGTAAWIGAFYTGPGFSLQILGSDLYSGQAGIAVALAAYLAEARAGRADPVEGLAEVASYAINGLRTVEDAAGYLRSGGLTGLGSGIWAWLTLNGLDKSLDALARAHHLAGEVPRELADETLSDVLDGAAGVIIPLLGLAERAGDTGLLGLAAEAAKRLEVTAQWSDRVVSWPRPGFRLHSGGFAHGTAGIGWALARLALATGSDHWLALAGAAFGYTESLYSAQAGGWKNVYLDQYQTSWCNGAAGIGLAACDLHQRAADLPMLDVIRRAASATLREGFGGNQSLCHGDMGAWEFLTAAAEAGALDAEAPDQATLDALAVTSAGRVEPAGQLRALGSTPGLLPGVAGVVYQLLRMAPDSALPSVLLLCHQ